MSGTVGLLLILGVLASGCGGESDAGQASVPVAPASTSAAAATTESATTARTSVPEAAMLRASDASGDTPSADLDIVEAKVTRDDLVRVELTLAEPPVADVIYSAMLVCGDQLWQLGYKVAAGTTTVFAFDFVGAQQYEADGAVAGSTVSISYPAMEMGCTGPIDVQLIAEGANGRAANSDYVPEPGPDVLNPKRLRVT